MRIATSLLLLPLLLLDLPLAAQTQGLELPVIFSDHMVLQQGKSVRVWGRDKPGTKITVRFGGQEKTSKTRMDGTWSLELDALEPGPARKLMVQGTSQKSFEDVLVGEVWICSGQSNMDFALKRSTGGKEATQAAKLPEIRLFKTERRTSKEPNFDVKSKGWQLADPKAAASFSAVAWYFGRQLHDTLGVPIGLVQTSWGGTRIQSWMSPKTLKRKSFKDLKQNWRRNDERHAAWQKQQDKWQQQAQRAKKAGKPVPKKPRKGRWLAERHRPGGLFLGMADPILPYGYAGAIWYQGEANLREADSYAENTRLLVQDWRRVSGQTLPFYWVQLASYHYKNASERQLPLLWESQDKARDLERTGMASAVDIGNPKDIHPKNKAEVGRRLSLLALAEIYTQRYPKKLEPLVPIESRGPELLTWKKTGKQVHLLFSHCTGGLIAKGELLGFEVANSKKKFFPAQARIEGQTVILTCPEVKSVKAVRYAFREPTPFPLYNQQGLPCTPFRTDDWHIKGQ